MNEFDDPQLEGQLGRLSGPYPDDNAAYAQVIGRVRQVKRRRAVAASAMAGALLFAGVAFTAGRSSTSRTLTPGLPDASGIDGSTEESAVSSTVESAVTSDSTPDPTVATDSSLPGQTATGSTAPAMTTPTSPTQPQSSTASSTPGSQPATTPPTAPATTVAPLPNSTVPPGPVTRSYSGVGGSITVRFANGSLTLIDSTASAGFTEFIILSSGDRVEVRFESTTHKTKVRVDVVGNSMQPYIEEQAT